MKSNSNYERYATLTAADRARIRKINKMNGYRIHDTQLISLAVRHKDARERRNLHEMELIEYRLKHLKCNIEARQLQYGRYDDLFRKHEQMQGGR